MVTSQALSWSELVPFLAALTVAQVAVVSVSKLVAGSGLYKVNRFGVYSEAAAALAYCCVSAFMIASWAHQDAGPADAAGLRSPLLVQFLGMYVAMYALFLFALLPMLMHRSHFRQKFGPAMVRGYVPVLVLCLAVVLLSLIVPYPVLVAAVTVVLPAALGWFLGYVLTWCGRRPLNWLDGRTSIRWRDRVAAWLARSPTEDMPGTVRAPSPDDENTPAHRP